MNKKNNDTFWKMYWEKPVGRVVKAMKKNQCLVNVMNPYTQFLTENEKESFYTLVAIFAIAPEDALDELCELLGVELFDFIMMYATLIKVFLNFKED